MTELLNQDDRRDLTEHLKQAWGTIDVLKAWLRGHHAEGLSELGSGALSEELTRLMTWANAVDGMRALLQALADNPPSHDIPFVIVAYTRKQIKPRQLTNHGLPPVSPDKSWFAASRPFVNRDALRGHLKDLEHSGGAEAVLVIDGDTRSGKSFAVSLALGFEVARNSPAPLDIDEFARVGAQLNAREFAVLIAGDDVGSPSYDHTKEDEAVPRLLYWLTGKLKGQDRWIIIDHCNRRVLTQGARTLLRDLAGRIRGGTLPDVRLILVDFDLNELPIDWRDMVRHDRAQLPDKRCVAEWCERLATAANRQHAAHDPPKWADEIFSGLAGRSLSDGTWHRTFERELRQIFNRIMSCREL
jgi:hypothetical protein